MKLTNTVSSTMCHFIVVSEVTEKLMEIFLLMALKIEYWTRCQWSAICDLKVNTSWPFLRLPALNCVSKCASSSFSFSQIYVCRFKVIYGIQAKLYRENSISVCNYFGNWWPGLSLRCICISSKLSEQNPFRFLTSRHDKRAKEECSVMGPWIIVRYLTVEKTVTAPYSLIA